MSSSANQNQSPDEAPSLGGTNTRSASGRSTSANVRIRSAGDALSRKAPTRTVAGLLRLLLAGLMLGGITIASVFGAYRYATTSPRFSVRNIEIDGLRRLTKDAVLERTGIRMGQNVFSVDTEVVSQRLFSERWVQGAKVERRLPATVRITLVEREAFALALVGETLLVVTKTGEPFKRHEPADPADLPVISGVSLEEPGREPAVEKRRIATGLEVLRHFERTTLSRTYPAQEVHLTPGGEVVLTVGKQAIALHLGTGPWAKKLAMAERVLGKLHGRKGAPAMVFLDNRAHPERVVVRMR
ncbi:MAG: FtsQ-type POTRA domain-containing protein [Polyangiaceae bacterium]